MSRALIVAEVALSLALVASTGLLLKSVSGLEGVDLGFDREGVVTFALEAPRWGDSAEEAAATMTAFTDRLMAVPGVREVGFTNRVPLGGGLFTGNVRSESMMAAESDRLETSMRFVTPHYFAALGARVTQGRAFRADDGLDATIVDERAAERLWPGQPAVGQTLEVTSIGEEPMRATVIGVVAPMKHAGVAVDAAETVFLPMLAMAHQQNFRYAAVRVADDPAQRIEDLRTAVREVDTDAVIARVRTTRELFDDDVAATRFASRLLSAFGLIALLLAVVGLHGVMAYSIRQRLREIGIRVALGAQHRALLARTVRSGLTLVASGIVVGIVVALIGGGALSALLFGVSPYDPGVLIGSAIALLLAGLVGTYLPARRVLAVDPAATLRDE